jgi:hypothetical protein
LFIELFFKVKDDFKVVFHGEFMVSLVDGVISSRPSSDENDYGSVTIYTDSRKSKSYFMFRSASPKVSLVYPYPTSDEMEILEVEFVPVSFGEDYMHEYVWLEFHFEEKDKLKIDVFLEESEDDFEAFEFMYSINVDNLELNREYSLIIKHPREDGMDKDYSFLVKIKRY